MSQSRMSVVWKSRFQKHCSQRILQNEVRETLSIPVRRVRQDVLFDERHALVLCQNSDSHDIPKRRPTALGGVANTDTKLLICSLFQKSRVLAQDGEAALRTLLFLGSARTHPAVYVKGHVDSRRRTPRVRGRRLPLLAAFAASGACIRSYKAKRYSTRSRSEVKRARR